MQDWNGNICRKTITREDGCTGREACPIATLPSTNSIQPDKLATPSPSKKYTSCRSLYQNQPDALISHIYFWNKTLHVSDSSSVHHQEFFTAHTAMVCVIQGCWQLASGIRTDFRPDPARKLSANLYDIYHCSVYSEKLLLMDRGTVRNMQSFIPKINLRN